MTYEPWHYRYVGKDAAKAIMQAGGTLEEYTGAVAGLCVIFQDRILAGIAALKGKFSLEKHGDL